MERIPIMSPYMLGHFIYLQKKRITFVAPSLIGSVPNSIR